VPWERHGRASLSTRENSLNSTAFMSYKRLKRLLSRFFFNRFI
jgi:hypothetical protein